jgi:hypothetical protein
MKQAAAEEVERFGECAELQQQIDALDARISTARAAGARKRTAAAAAAAAVGTADAKSEEDAAMRARLAKQAAREARHISLATAESGGVSSVNDLPFDEVEDVEGGFDRTAPALRGTAKRVLHVEMRAAVPFIDGNARPFVLHQAVLTSANEEVTETIAATALRDTLDRTTFCKQPPQSICSHHACTDHPHSPSTATTNR